MSSIASIDSQRVFVSLLASDLDRKVFAVVPISDDIWFGIKSLLSDAGGASGWARWNAIQDRIAEVRNKCDGSALLMMCKQFGERSLVEKEVAISDDLRSQLGRGIDVALKKDNADRWFQLMEGV